MKNRANKILLAVFLLSLPLYVAMAYTYITYEFAPHTTPSHFEIWFARRFLLWMALGFHAVPTFCLQLLLCRKVHRFLASCPALLLLGILLCMTCAYRTATGWDDLGCLLVLLLSIAPAVGCALAWTVFGLHQFYKRGNIRG